MKKGTKILTIMAIGLLLIILRASFVPLQLNERAIILGVGVDYEQTTQNYSVTVEIITPKQNAMGSESSASEGSQKIVKGSGQTVGFAIRNLFNSFGKTPSFGECAIIILGQDCVQQTNLKDTLDYFIASGSFRDGTVVVVAEGKAGDIMQKRSQVDEYVSFALQTLLVDSGNRAQIQYTTLNTTAQSFFDHSKGCFLNYIQFVKEDSSSSDVMGQQDKQGKFTTGQMAIFSDGKYVGLLNRQQINGLNLYGNKKIFCVFSDVKNPNTKAFGLDKKTNDKEIKIQDGRLKIKVTLKLGLKELLTDSVGEVIALRRKETSSIDDQTLLGIKQQVEECLTSVLNKSIETQCDFLGIKNNLFANYGKDCKQILDDNQAFWQNIDFEMEVSCEG